MGLKKKAEDKILDAALTLRANAQAQFVNWVANEEGWDFDTAWLVCNGEHPDIHKPEYTLGYKLADPITQTSFHLARKKNREAAREKFREGLTDEERQLFDSEDPEEERQLFKKKLSIPKNKNHRYGRLTPKK